AFDDNNGIRISYQYAADAQGSVSISVAPIRATFTHHLYGFSNRELQPAGSSVSLSIAQASAGSLVISWPQSATGYVLKSSNTLGSTAHWQPVSGNSTVVNGNNQVT